MYREEIKYKDEAWYNARNIIQIDKWHTWRNRTGEILKRMRKACESKVHHNLLFTRIPKNRSHLALYQVKTKEQIRGLEGQLYNFFLGNNGSTNPEDVRSRFDALVSYFDENNLHKNWPFFSYLIFLLDKGIYFPILPSQFQHLLDFYGIKEKLRGNFSWEQYFALVGVAKFLKDNLVEYEPLDGIKIQSYMWVLSRRIMNKKVKPEDITIKEPLINYSEDLKRRDNKDGENNRIGIMGEEFVRIEEEKKLKMNRVEYLIEKIERVSITGTDWGYDLKSVDLDGNPIYIEVKTTTGSPSDNDNFILTKKEYDRALKDKDRWHLYRVYNIYNINLRSIKDLNNVVNDGGWEFKPEQLRVTRKK